MAALVVMEAPSLTRPQTKVTDLLNPEYAVPRHDPADISPQPCQAHSARKKISVKKTFRRISLRQVQSNDSNYSSQMGNQALQQDQQLRRPPQERWNDGECQSGRMEPSQQVGYSEGRQVSVGQFTDIRAHLPSNQLGGRKAKPNLLFLRRLWPARDQGESITNIITVSSEQTRTNIIDVYNTTVSGETTEAVTAAQTGQGMTQESPVISDPASPAPTVLNVQGAASTQNIEAVEVGPDTEVVSIGDRRLFEQETGVFVGYIYDLPPPALRETESLPIRTRLSDNIITATQTLPRRKRHRNFEVELCMLGQAEPGQQAVTLRPTILIRCGSKECQKVVQGVVTHLFLPKRFPVYVTLSAPYRASSGPQEHMIGNNPTLPVTQDEILPHTGSSTSDILDPADNCIRRIGDNDFLIRVQSFVSNHGSACGLTIEFRHSPSGRLYTCKLGGLICIDNQIFGLTTAHAMCSPNSFGILAGESFSSTTHLVYGPPQEKDTTDTSESTNHESWIPAKLWAARYGVSPQPSESGTSQTSSPTSEDNYDFALLQIDLSADVLPMNRYFHQPDIPRHVIRHSPYLKGRSVSLICSYEDVRPGQLLDGDRVFFDESGCWETRKIQLQTPLGAGASGTWVVDGSALLGIVIAVYDNEPYVHMLPIASVFSGIQAIASKESKRSDVRVADARTLRMHKQNARQAQSQNKLPEASKPDETLEIRKVFETKRIGQPKPQSANNTEQDVGEPPKEEVDHTNDRESANNRDIDTPIKLRWASFFTMCFLVFAIGLDSSAFPIIMPAITDSFNSINLIGWYGSVYPLVVGTTFPNFTRLYRLLYKLKGTKLHFTLFFASVLTLEGGLICCIFAPNSAVMLLGRNFCGLGAAGSVSGIAFYLTEILPEETKLRRSRIGVLLIIYAFSRFLGPLVAAVMLDRLHLEDAWRRVFIFHSAVMAVPFILVLLHFIQIYVVRWKYRRAIHWPRFQPRSLTQDPTATRSDWFCFLKKDVAAFISSSGALVCLELGLYYGAMYAWRKALVISLLVLGTGGCLVCFILNQVWNASLAIVPLRKVKPEMVMIIYMSFCWGASYHAIIHYLPFWLRIVRGFSPLKVGTTYLPTGATYLFSCGILLFSQGIHKKWPTLPPLSSAFVPYLGVMAPLGIGLMSRFNTETSISKLIGLQLLFSIGANFTAFQSIFSYSIYANNPKHPSFQYRIELANLMMFMEMIGGFVGISVAQTVFLTQLSRGVRDQELALQPILYSGATNFKEGLSDELRIKALGVFNNALTKAFLVSTTVGALPFATFVLGGIVTIPFLVYKYVRRRREPAA